MKMTPIGRELRAQHDALKTEDERIDFTMRLSSTERWLMAGGDAPAIPGGAYEDEKSVGI